MGRRKIHYKIPIGIMGGIVQRLQPSLHERIKEIAQSKGISVQTLIEIYLERQVKDHDTTKH